MHVLYLHGFASSPSSSKAVFFAERLAERGHPAVLPDLNEDDFEHLTISRMLACIAKAAETLPSPLAIIGSSLGGYAAALHVANGGRCDALALLAPAFDPVARWSAGAKPGDLERWRTDGSALFDHHAYNKKLPLAYTFFEDAHRHAPWPDVRNVPTVVIAGARDEVVPISTAREYAARFAQVELRELDTDHEMKDALPLIWTHVERFLTDSLR